MNNVKDAATLAAILAMSSDRIGNAYPQATKARRHMTFAVLAAQERALEKRTKRRNKIKAQRAQNVRRQQKDENDGR
jgi:hypothetical protein